MHNRVEGEWGFDPMPYQSLDSSTRLGMQSHLSSIGAFESIGASLGDVFQFLVNPLIAMESFQKVDVPDVKKSTQSIPARFILWLVP